MDSSRRLHRIIDSLRCSAVMRDAGCGETVRIPHSAYRVTSVNATSPTTCSDFALSLSIVSPDV